MKFSEALSHVKDRLVSLINEKDMDNLKDVFMENSKYTNSATKKEGADQIVSELTKLIDKNKSFAIEKDSNVVCDENTGIITGISTWGKSKYTVTICIVVKEEEINNKKVKNLKISNLMFGSI